MNIYLFQKILGTGTIILHVILALLISYLIYTTLSKKRWKILEEYLFNKRTCLITIFSGVSIIISLVFSEHYGVLPCTLCWVQRILIFAITVLGIIFFVTKKNTYIYMLLLAIPGALVAAYQTMTQFQLQATPLIECVAIPGADCAKINMLEYGYITIPVMSLTLFACVVLLGIRKQKNLNNDDKRNTIE
jgi:disulfide bond formation protein DsbB